MTGPYCNSELPVDPSERLMEDVVGATCPFIRDTTCFYGQT